MSILPNRLLGTNLDRPFGADWWVIGGEPFRNSAAKFWSRLLDEAEWACPECAAAVLSSVDEHQLAGKLLAPEQQLDLDAALVRNQSIKSILANLALEAELFGPPQPVRLLLQRHDDTCPPIECPVECVDTDLFPCLLVWLLQWADIPEFLWNSVSAAGAFTAEDVLREITCQLRFELHNRPLSEGLHERRLTLRWRKS